MKSNTKKWISINKACSVSSGTWGSPGSTCPSSPKRGCDARVAAVDLGPGHRLHWRSTFCRPSLGPRLAFRQAKDLQTVEEDHIDHLGWSRILYEKIGWYFKAGAELSVVQFVAERLTEKTCIELVGTLDEAAMSDTYQLELNGTS